jgi:hypothetical protein
MGIPEEGLAICREDYAQHVVFELVKEKAGAMIPANIVKGYIQEAVADLYARGLFIVRAMDDAHMNYVHQTLDEYRTKDVRYVITMRALTREQAKQYASQPQPEAQPVADPYQEMPPEADLPTRG